MGKSLFSRAVSVVREGMGSGDGVFDAVSCWAMGMRCNRARTVWSEEERRERTLALRPLLLLLLSSGRSGSL